MYFQAIRTETTERETGPLGKEFFIFVVPFVGRKRGIIASPDPLIIFICNDSYFGKRRKREDMEKRNRKKMRFVEGQER